MEITSLSKKYDVRRLDPEDVDIICETVVCLREMGYREIRLGVDKGNPQSNSFWTKNGFHKIREDKYIEMSRKIE